MAEDLGGSYYGDRWSFNLARPPGWLADESAAVIRWYHDNVFDRQDLDPNATTASIENSMRQDAARLGVRLPDDSAGVLRLYGRLQIGETSWAAIAGSDGSAATSGGGPNLLDQIAAAQSQVLTSTRAADLAAGGGYVGPGDNIEESDALILGVKYSNAGLSGAIAGGAPSYAAVPAPTPARGDAAMLARTQTGYTGYGGFNTQSAFSGVGTSGLLPQSSAAAGTMAASSGKGLLILAALGVAYFMLRKHLR